MNDNSPLLELPWSCEDALVWLQRRLAADGMRTMRTFDLKSTHLASAQCPCPDHGTAACDCQMVVLLVYHQDRGPLSIIAHGHGQHTWFVLVDTAEQPADPILAAAVQGMLVPGRCIDIYQENHA